MATSEPGAHEQEWGTSIGSELSGPALARAALEHERELRSVFRELHEHPELSGREAWTTDYVAKWLSHVGIESTVFEGRTGVVGHIPGPRGSRTVALRCDMDGLPISEGQGTKPRSKAPGVMHACGHDFHMTACLGAARLLAGTKGKLPFRVKLIFQPAEETSQGARELVDHGVLQSPAVDYIIGLHANPDLEAGTVGLTSGLVTSSETDFAIEVEGIGGHAAEPQRGRDAIVAAAAVVIALQSVVARRIDPRDAAVVSVGLVDGGRSTNQVADRVTLRGTVRCLGQGLDGHVRRSVSEISEKAAAAYGCQCKVNYSDTVPPVGNDPGLVDSIRAALEEALGVGHVTSWPPSMVSEDFGYYLERVPGLFLWMGTTGKGQTPHPLHTAAFQVDERAIAPAVTALCVVAAQLGNRGV
jgi:amidohydrolase